jgi:type II secretory pathway component GspD/PulD (secretin)
LRARPFVVVASGETGTLFLGQSRFVTVLQQRRGRQIAQALRLPVGASLTVTPIVGAGDDILLDLNPRVSTVDEVEQGTGLPTLGIREIESVLRLRPGESALIAGLDADLDFDTRRPLSRARANRKLRSFCSFLPERLDS